MYTVKQAAEAMGKSKSALEYHIRNLTAEQQAEYITRAEDGKRFITEEGFKMLYERVKGAPEPQTPPRDNEAPGGSNSARNESEAHDLVPLQAYQSLAATVNILNGQLKEKDEQIKKLLDLLEKKPRRSFWAWLTGRD